MKLAKSHHRKSYKQLNRACAIQTIKHLCAHSKNKTCLLFSLWMTILCKIILFGCTCLKIILLWSEAVNKWSSKSHGCGNIYTTVSRACVDYIYPTRESKLESLAQWGWKQEEQIMVSIFSSVTLLKETVLTATCTTGKRFCYCV